MSTSESEAVRQLVHKLNKWIKKRRAKQLDCGELIEAVRYLSEYVLVLENSEC